MPVCSLCSPIEPSLALLTPLLLASMPTSFSQVHLPPHTIDSVRTIVSLPLLHPSSFQHGILKEHGMTGCLLFGPPGTGKTLVVRALAKEAGCRMLAVTPSDVMDMVRRSAQTPPHPRQQYSIICLIHVVRRRRREARPLTILACPPTLSLRRLHRRNRRLVRRPVLCARDWGCYRPSRRHH